MTKGEEAILNNKIMNEIINGDAVFSDETETFLFPFEPNENDEVRVRLRVGTGDAEAVYVVSNNEACLMKLERKKDIFEYYSFTFPPESENRAYYFRIICGGEIYYYNRYGLSKEINEEGSFVIDRHYKTPDWAKGAVGYQIFTDRFYNGDRKNDVKDN